MAFLRSLQKCKIALPCLVGEAEQIIRHLLNLVCSDFTGVSVINEEDQTLSILVLTLQLGSVESSVELGQTRRPFLSREHECLKTIGTQL